MQKINRLSHMMSVLNSVYSLPSRARILDLGCGNGDIVMLLNSKNLSAFGCDFQFKEGKNVKLLRERQLIRVIESPYVLPFEDCFFDVILSDNVFEHVRDYRGTMAEIYRVLKPGGGSLHFFSSRYRPMEVHRIVPFGSIVKSYWWLAIWAYLGVRTRGQKKKNMSRMEVLENNFFYLNNHTNYLSKTQIIGSVTLFFQPPLFCEKYFLKYSKRGKCLYYASKIFPFIPSLYSCFCNRILFFKKSVSDKK